MPTPEAPLPGLSVSAPFGTSRYSTPTGAEWRPTTSPAGSKFGDDRAFDLACKRGHTVGFSVHFNPKDVTVVAVCRECSIATTVAEWRVS